MKLLFVLFAVVFVLALAGAPTKASKKDKETKTAAKNCYSTVAKCVPTVKPTTGILWKDCSEYCKKCRGKDIGECAKSNTAACKGFYCKCSGKRVDKTENLQEAATCRLGL